jgi:hypothetical protein
MLFTKTEVQIEARQCLCHEREIAKDAAISAKDAAISTKDAEIFRLEQILKDHNIPDPKNHVLESQPRYVLQFARL